MKVLYNRWAAVVFFCLVAEGSPGQDSSDISSYVIGIVEKGPRWTGGESVLELQHRIHLDRMESGGFLLADAKVLDDGDILGILFFRSASMFALQDLVADDPAVRAGRITVSLHRWIPSAAMDGGWRDHPELLGKDDLELQIGFLEKGPNWRQDADSTITGIQNAHVEHLNRLMEEGSVALAGPVIGEGALLGMLVFRMKSVKEVLQTMGDDPAIQSGRLAVKALAITIPAGIIP